MDKNILASLKRVTAGANKIMPILDYLRFKDGIITGTDLEVTIDHKYNDDLRVYGDGCILATDFLKLVTRFNKLLITFNSEKGNVVTIPIGANREIILPTEKVEYFPNPERNCVVYHGKLIVDKLFKNLKGFTGKDEIRPHFSGVFFEEHKEHGGVYVVTDTHQLIWNNHDLKRLPENGILIPRAVFDLPLADYQMYTNFEEKYTMLVDGGTSYMIRNIDSKFPDWDAVVPRTNEYTINFDKKELIGILEDVIAIMPETGKGEAFKIVPIKYEKGVLSSSDLDTGKGFGAKVWFDVSDYEAAWHFNAVAMLEICKKLIPAEVSEIELSVLHPKRGGIINKNILLMPLFID